MSLQAYQQAAARAESPRDIEYRLFGQVTRALIAAADLDVTDIAGRMEALDWNRRLWSVLASDCSSPGNQLPVQLRASIISLSLWVNRHTSEIMRNEAEFGPLIDVNRMMMQGLEPARETPAAA
ncbi:flagellar biosynthesis regulator FlaF [Phenylobacterium soli]|uniref:Flagellar biosynthesis regulatory protein FlaF n=1 Tax=Phenylobacterium soli TaxID=2170551 RepID=A0A328ARQ0_9CAUL|nr:flagellar biosynthesis regulator FlaF [Phenylobacterium soli]RAK55618.1 flagellar biosynthesis regulatory protein FlaF [Phenylobacterium soli]